MFFLCEWYRRKKAVDPRRPSDMYLDMALPWAGFLLRRGYAWNAEPDRLLAFLVEFLRDDEGVLLAPMGSVKISGVSRQRECIISVLKKTVSQKTI